VEIEEPSTKARWGLVWGLLFVLGGLAALPFLLYQFYQFRPKTLPSYQIQNFTGAVEVYTRDKRMWVQPRRGESLGSRDKIRTGPGGEIDLQKSGILEARQLDLSKEAGSLFQYVFDHGTFYTPQFGFAEREFIKDAVTGKVRLELSYDVFPKTSFGGVYLKTRNFDLSRFKALKFQARGDPKEGYPESIRIELKSGRSVIRAFAPRDFKESWQSFAFPFRVNRPTPISEITLVISHEKAQRYPKGKLHLREVDFEPAV